MDATQAIIILLFFVTILSASTGGKKTPPPQAPKFPKYGLEMVEPISQIQKDIPSPSYSAVAYQDVLSDIRDFIVSYAPKVVKEEARIIAGNIVRFSQQHDVNPKLVAALIARESRFNRYAVSSSNAQGLGQLLPSTAATLEVDDPFNIEQNVRGTTRYFKSMLDRWEGKSQQVPLALASYKDGYNAVKRNGGYSNHTQRYINDIIDIYWSI